MVFTWFLSAVVVTMVMATNGITLHPETTQNARLAQQFDVPEFTTEFSVRKMTRKR